MQGRSRHVACQSFCQASIRNLPSAIKANRTFLHLNPGSRARECGCESPHGIKLRTTLAQSKPTSHYATMVTKRGTPPVKALRLLWLAINQWGALAQESTTSRLQKAVWRQVDLELTIPNIQATVSSTNMWGSRKSLLRCGARCARVPNRFGHVYCPSLGQSLATYSSLKCFSSSHSFQAAAVFLLCDMEAGKKHLADVRCAGPCRA